MGGGKLEARQNLYSIAARSVFTLRKICRLSAKLAGANPKLKFSLVNSSKIYSPRMIQLEVNAYSTPPPMLKPFNHLFWETVNALGRARGAGACDRLVCICECPAAGDIQQRIRLNRVAQATTKSAYARVAEFIGEIERMPRLRRSCSDCRCH